MKVDLEAIRGRSGGSSGASEDIRTLLGLVESQSGTIDRLTEAFERSDKGKVYLDGFNAARDMVMSVRVGGVMWGPNATPDDGLKLGVDSVKEAFARHDARK